MLASDALGRWVLAKDTPVRMGVSIFTLRAGAEVKVLQVDPECGKVLVQAGRDVEWLHHTWLGNCVRPYA